MNRVLRSPWAGVLAWLAIGIPFATLGLWSWWVVGLFLVLHIMLALSAMRRRERFDTLRAIENECTACGVDNPGATLYVRRGLGEFWLCTKHIDQQADWKRWRISKFRVPQ